MLSVSIKQQEMITLNQLLNFILKVTAISAVIFWVLMLLGFLTDSESIGLVTGIIILIILGIPTFLLYKKAFQKKANHTQHRTYERPTYSASKNIDIQKRNETFDDLRVEAEVATPVEIHKKQEYKPTQTSKQEKAIPTPTVDSRRFTFNVAGVTQHNDKNRDIQKLLRRFGKLYCEENLIELYGGFTNKDILEYVSEVSEFEDLEFKDNEISFVPEPTNEYDPNAIKVFIDYGNEEIHHIGYVPKKHTAELKNLLDSKNVLAITACYVGGKIKETDYDLEKDKDIVVTNELTSGVKVEIKYKEQKR